MYLKIILVIAYVALYMIFFKFEKSIFSGFQKMNKKNRSLVNQKSARFFGLIKKANEIDIILYYKLRNKLLKKPFFN